jgi:hypothetical protein
MIEFKFTIYLGDSEFLTEYHYPEDLGYTDHRWEGLTDSEKQDQLNRYSKERVLTLLKWKMVQDYPSSPR